MIERNLSERRGIDKDFIALCLYQLSVIICFPFFTFFLNTTTCRTYNLSYSAIYNLLYTHILSYNFFHSYLAMRFNCTRQIINVQSMASVKNIKMSPSVCHENKTYDLNIF